MNFNTISNYDLLPINLLINDICQKKDAPCTFEDLKSELTKKVEDIFLYNLNVKEDDDLGIIYYHNNESTSTDLFKKSVEDTCKSYVVEKSTLKPITSQFNRIIYNSEGIEVLKQFEWNKLVIQKCYEGTMILLFHHNDKWYVCTRRCIDSSKSFWIKNKSYSDMFYECAEGKMNIDELDKNLTYHFILIHYRNKNIVTYNNLGEEYRELYHVMTTEKGTLKEVQYNISGNIKIIAHDQFNNLEEIEAYLKHISNIDEKRKRVSSEGLIIRAYHGEVYNSPFTIIKLQTEIYQKLMKIKPNNSCDAQIHLALYQKDKLAEYLPYFSNFGAEIINRINKSIKNLSVEILDLYFLTRNKKNPAIYNNLTEGYKKVLYSLHKIYIENRRNDFVNGLEVKRDNHHITWSMNVHVVYKYIKYLPENDLRQLFYDRIHLANNPINTFINNDCIYTKTQCVLMFN